MQAAIIVFPGTNRERDMRLALKRASGRDPVMLFHREAALPKGLDLVVLPGGFPMAIICAAVPWRRNHPSCVR